jgi:hypothetical protein
MDGPLFDEAFANIGIVSYEVFHTRIVVNPEHERRTIGWVSVGARKKQLASLVRLPCEPEVFFPKPGTALHVVIDQLVEKPGSTPQ